MVYSPLGRHHSLVVPGNDPFQPVAYPGSSHSGCVTAYQFSRNHQEDVQHSGLSPIKSTAPWAVGSWR